MLIRQETQRDYREIHQMIREAFAGADHADGTEQDLVAELRRGEAEPICGVIKYAKEFGI